MAEMAALPPTVAAHAVVADVAGILEGVGVVVPRRQVQRAAMGLAAVCGGDRDAINDQLLAVVVAPEVGLDFALFAVQRQCDADGFHGALPGGVDDVGMNALFATQAKRLHDLFVIFFGIGVACARHC